MYRFGLDEARNRMRKGHEHGWELEGEVILGEKIGMGLEEERKRIRKGQSMALVGRRDKYLGEKLELGWRRREMR